MSLESAQRFLRYLKAGNRSRSTLYDYERTYSRFFSKHQELTTETVDAFLDRVSPRTRGKYRTQLYGLAKFLKTAAVDWEQIPPSKLHIERPRIITPEESLKIWVWLKKWDSKNGTFTALTYQLILHTGLRIGELITLEPQSLQSDSRQMPFLVISKASGRSHSRDGRIIPLDRTAARLVASNGLPIRIKERTFNYTLHRACRCVGLTEVYAAHAVRKTCFSRWHEQGMDLKTIADLAGHSSTDTLNHYLERSPESLRRKMMKALHHLDAD